MLSADELPACPVMTTLRLIGNKWKILILQQLLMGPHRYSEIHRAVQGISEKVLTENLKAMENDGIITRTVYPEVPVRVEYALSDVGESMRPIIQSMEKWGLSYQALVKNSEDATASQ